MSEDPIANTHSDLEVAANRDRPTRFFSPRRPLSQPVLVDIDPVMSEYDKQASQTVRPVHTSGATDGRYRNPFGWSPLVFGLVVGLTTATIVGAVVGGGVGAALSSHR